MIARSGDVSTPRIRRRWIVLAAVLASFFVLGWMDGSASSAVDLGSPTRIVLVSAAGPVDVVRGESAELHHQDSWLISKPLLELAEQGGEAVVRVTCPGRFPCRSSVRLQVPDGIELVIVATDGIVQINEFEGELTVFATGSDGVVLGPVGGSVRVVADNGAVRGFGLQVGDFDVDVEAGRVDLLFAQVPTSVAVQAGNETVRLRLPERRYRVDVETDSANVEVALDVSETSTRVIAVKSTGPVQVVPTP